MAYTLIRGGNTVAGGAHCSGGGGAGGGHMGRPQRGPPNLPALAWPAQACQPASLPCTHSLTAGKGTRENLFLVPIQPFQPLQRPPWSGVFSTNSRRNYRGHSSRERGRSKISRFVIFINYLQVNQSCLNFFIFIMDTKI